MIQSQIKWLRQQYRWLVLTLFIVLMTAIKPADSSDFVLNADDWARPRSAAYIITLAPIKNAVAQWMDEPKKQIMIRYPGGEAGLLWAAELQDWLVAFGIPSRHIEPSLGSPREDQLIISVE